MVFEANLFIGGMSVAANDASTYERFDPIQHKVVTTAAAASRQDALNAGNAAAAAFPTWSATEPAERAGILNGAAETIQKNVDAFISVMAEETGASATWARFNCELASGMFRHAATLAGRLTEPDASEAGRVGVSYIVRQPAGVVFGIAPWNAPVTLGVRAIAAPIALGNTVVLKASELCPKTHSMIADCLAEAGLPAGVVNVLTNAPEAAAEIVEALIGHDAVRRVNFTGSTRVGRKIAEICARHLKPCLLELSGKASLIVLDDADIDAAVNAAAYGAFFNQGQVCISTERIIVDRKVADEFLAKFAEKTATLQAGDPRNGDFPLGSMISEDATNRVAGLVNDAVRKGATLVAGGTFDGTLMQPTVLDGVTSAMRIFTEESFGPVAAIMRAGGMEEAITLANATEYGLAASVYGRDVERALSVARRIESGICHVNAPTIYDDPSMPFGGMKSSGYGRFGGDAAIHEFTELRWISVHDGAQQFPI